MLKKKLFWYLLKMVRKTVLKEDPCNAGSAVGEVRLHSE